MTSFYAVCQDALARRFAKAFWQTEGTPGYQMETILPKGVIELIFSFNEPISLSRNSQTTHTSTPRCFISGLSDTPIQLRAPKQQAFFGIELHPAAVKRLLKIPAGEFLNSITDLETVNKAFNDLWHQLAAVDSFHARMDVTRQWLHQKSCSIAEQEMAISGFLGTRLDTHSVADQARVFSYSTRQLHRKVLELFGMSTEGLIRYKRYIHSLHLMHRSHETLTSIGYDCLYYDQAHFIREFSSFTGLTPGKYRQQKSSLAGHLYNNVRYVQ